MDDAVQVLMEKGVLDAAGAEKVRAAARTMPLEDAIRQVVPEMRLFAFWQPGMICLTLSWPSSPRLRSSSEVPRQGAAGSPSPAHAGRARRGDRRHLPGLRYRRPG